MNRRPGLALLALGLLGVGLYYWAENGPRAAGPSEDLDLEEDTQSPQEQFELAKPLFTEGARQKRQAPTDVAGSPETASPPIVLSRSLADVKAAIHVLPEYYGDLDGFGTKYDGLTAEDLELIYPALRAIRVKEMFSALDDAVRTNRAVYVPLGEPIDPAQYAPPGSTVHAMVSRTEGQMQQAVWFGPDSYPDVYVRILEETWVHDRMDEAGLCKGDNYH